MVLYSSVATVQFWTKVWTWTSLNWTEVQFKVQHICWTKILVQFKVQTRLGRFKPELDQKLCTLSIFTILNILDKISLVYMRIYVECHTPQKEKSLMCHTISQNVSHKLEPQVSKYRCQMSRYSGSKKCPNICLFYKDINITQCWHN